ADRGDQEQQRRDFNREQELCVERDADRLHVADRGDRFGRQRPGAAGQPTVEEQRHQQRREDDAENGAVNPFVAPRRQRDVRYRVDQGDDEDEEHHDRARIDDYLGGEEELGIEQQEEQRQP